MPRKKKETVTTKEVEEQIDVTPTEEQKQEVEEQKEIATVYDNKRVVRVYSLKQHGKDFEKLANQYVSKPGRTKYTILTK